MIQGKNALVTGSTSGIGLGIARQLARAGANVMLNGFGDADEIEQIRAGLEDEYGVRALYSGANMTQVDQIEALITRVVDEVDFDRVRQCTRTRIFVSATNVETGRVRVFSGEELDLDAVMPSACLPQLFRALEIDRVPYWDGGFAGNPALFPFFEVETSSDILIVQINPIFRPGTPRTARQILDRVNEITFNAALLKELRAIDFVSRLVERGAVDPDEYRKMYIHILFSDPYLKPLGASSKLNASWSFLKYLRDKGRHAARQWLRQHFDDIGERTTVDLRAMYQTGHPGL